jgi:hypothetical protein
LSVEQWQRIEGAAKRYLKSGARKSVLQLLNAGKIHPGLDAIDRIKAFFTKKVPAASTSSITGNVNVAGETFHYPGGELGFVMAHEARHTQQSFFMTPNSAERDADSYACDNEGRADRGGYADGGYPDLGGCQGK